MTKRKVFIGVAWPYVNGTLHIGHFSGYLLPADICARYHRLLDEDVLMVSGSDCFGTPITVEADKRGVSPREIVDDYHEKDVELFLDILDLTYDLYTKTDHPNHIKVVQDMFVDMLQKDYIYVDCCEQYYSEKDNKFLPDRYVIGKCPFCGFEDARSDQCDNCGRLISQDELLNPRSNLTGEPVAIKETEHYFVNWTKLQKFLEEYVYEKGSLWKDWVNSQTNAWLDEGLEPRAVTRDLDWGVPIPIDRIPEEKRIKEIDSKRIYVWYEAVIGYLSASIQWSQMNDLPWQPFWRDSNEYDLKHFYFMGKDNLVFHTLFWPGQLHVYDPTLHLPDVVSINMFLNLEGKQFSKSRGVVINIKDIVEQYGKNPVRFYTVLTMPEVRDSSFSWKDFEEKVNGILVANLGNFIHRVLSIQKNENEDQVKNGDLSFELSNIIDASHQKISDAYEECRFRDSLEVILELSQYGNKLIDEAELWILKEKNTSEYYAYLYELNIIILSLGYFMNPILPDASKTLLDMYGISCDLWPLEDEFSKHITKKFKESSLPRDPKPLFKKIELSQVDM